MNCANFLQIFKYESIIDEKIISIHTESGDITIKTNAVCYRF